MLSKVPTPQRSARAAFTLLEIMIALAILGLLVGLAVNNIGNIFGNSQVDVARIFVKQTLKGSLQTYSIDNGGYPSTADGLSGLMTKPASASSSKWRGPYVEEGSEWPPRDPWGELYQYRFPGQKAKPYDLWSKGPDKTDGTADDIGNWPDPTAPAEETK
jgi:general secretion pathway protein G